MFITFEGLDSSGKTTQAELLVRRLREEGKEPLFLREPGGTAISELIRGILLDRRHLDMSQKAELLLFAAARTQLVTQVIRPALRSGTIVVCDRFTDSTTAYQGYGRGLDPAEVEAVNAIATDGTSPDLTLFMRVDVDEILLRRRQAGSAEDRMEASGRPFFERVHAGYLAIAAAARDRVRVVDGMQPVEAVQRDVWNLVRTHIG